MLSRPPAVASGDDVSGYRRRLRWWKKIERGEGRGPGGAMNRIGMRLWGCMAGQSGGTDLQGGSLSMLFSPPPS